MGKRKDYHEYVFKDGKLIGKFEEMYKYSINIPWHQNEVDKFPDIQVSKYLLKYKAPYRSLLEIGCGLGYHLNEISHIVTDKNNIIGIDISKTAISKAKVLFPNFNFLVGDLTSENYQLNFTNIVRGAEIVVIRAFFWYVFDKIEIVLENILNLMRNNGYLFIHQNFPPLSNHFVGKEVIPNPEALINFFIPNFEIILRNDFNIAEKNSNDYWLSLLLRKK